MYVTSRDTEGDGKLMFGRSENILQDDKFGAVILQNLNELKLSGKFLSQGNSNLALLAGLAANSHITRLEVVGAKASIKAEDLTPNVEGRVFINEKRSENQFFQNGFTFYFV